MLCNQWNCTKCVRFVALSRLTYFGFVNSELCSLTYVVICGHCTNFIWFFLVLPFAWDLEYWINCDCLLNVATCDMNLFIVMWTGRRCNLVMQLLLYKWSLIFKPRNSSELPWYILGCLHLLSSDVCLCQLWSSGFGISLSLASGTLNGDKINATMYYVLSQTPSPLSELDRPQAEKLELEKLLYFPDRCYDGHHTL